jgi:hypothetical protein
MSSVKSLKEEIESLKEQAKVTNHRMVVLHKNQETLNKRISAMENGTTLDVEPKKQGVSIAGIIMIVIGALISLTVIGAIIGIPLLIWGIILVSNRSNGTTEEKIEPEEIKPKKVEHKIEASKTPPKPKRKRITFEEDVGMKWFARIGILALVIGVGFFIKYAIDMNWISHLTRIIMGAALGIGLIIFGEVVSKKEKYANWARTLVGGGFAITYFVVFAAYHFREYQRAIGITQTVDIILLSLVVIFAVLFSLKENSQIIAAESFFLGYITSLLSNDFGTMTLVYGLILTIGLITVVSYKKWSIIGIGGVVASYGMFLLWLVDNQKSFMYSSFILISYFVAFTIQSLFLMKKKGIFGQNIATILINSASFFILYFLLLDHFYPQYTGLLALALSVFYLVIYYVSQVIREEKYVVTHLYLALLYITITIPLQLNSEWITIVWALEALLLTIMYLKFNVKTLKIGSYVVGGVTALKTICYDLNYLDKLDFANIMNSTRLFSFLVTIVCFYFIYKLLKDKLLKKDSFVPILYSWFATGFLLLIVIIELMDNYSVWVSVILSVLALIYMLVSSIDKKEMSYQSLVISAILIIKVLFYDSWSLAGFTSSDLLSSTRFFAFAIAILAFYAIIWCLEHRKTGLEKYKFILTNIYSYTGFIFLFVLIMVEMEDFWMTVGWSALALVFMLISSVKRKEMAYQSLAVSVILFIKVLFYDSWNLAGFTASDLLASARFFAFVITILIFYIISWCLENKKTVLEKYKIILANVYSYAGAILLFVLIMVEMEDFWMSVGWSILALVIMLSGFVFGKKHLRMQGMIIFAITIAKVFLYDTRNLDTIYRTVSYIVLGVILLLVSFIYTKYKEKLKEII